MNVLTNVRTALLPLLLAATIAPPLPAQDTDGETAPALELIDLRKPFQVNGDVAAGREKAATCGTCHGEAGISSVPMFPHLAGQPADYLYWELVAMKRAARPRLVMTPLVMPLSDQDMRDLAAYYASLPPGRSDSMPAPDATAEQRERGGELYLHGDPERGVPPCQGCHGADALGIDAYPEWPLLRGQPATYLTQKLHRFQVGDEVDTSQDLIMEPVARALSEDDVVAVSAWLASLPFPADADR